MKARSNVEDPPGEPATGVLDNAPSASEDEESHAHQRSEEHVEDFIKSTEHFLLGERGRQTLTGAVIVARSIIFAGVLISRAIRESRNTPS